MRQLKIMSCAVAFVCTFLHVLTCIILQVLACTFLHVFKSIFYTCLPVYFARVYLYILLVFTCIIYHVYAFKFLYVETESDLKKSFAERMNLN